MKNNLVGAVTLSNQQPPSQRKPTVEAATNKPLQNFVTCIHRAKIADLCRNVTVTWFRHLISHSLLISVENPGDDNQYTCKIDLKTWQFWGKKGLKSFKVDEKRLDIFWDLRYAKFTTSPEPCSDYYVALVSNEEVVLVLGDQKKEAFRRTKSRPSLVDATLVQKKENVFARNCFCTRSMLGKGKKEHHIVIESSLSGMFDPEMWIGIDGIELIRIMNLHWRFRGNETILVDNIPVHIFWDVHDWLYCEANSGPGLFIFTQGALECITKSHQNGDGCHVLAWEDQISADFCHLLYAWKTD